MVNPDNFFGDLWNDDEKPKKVETKVKRTLQERIRLIKVFLGLTILFFIIMFLDMIRSYGAQREPYSILSTIFFLSLTGLVIESVLTLVQFIKEKKHRRNKRIL